jgi:hypothetical protein
MTAAETDPVDPAGKQATLDALVAQRDATVAEVSATVRSMLAEGSLHVDELADVIPAWALPAVLDQLSASGIGTGEAHDDGAHRTALREVGDDVHDVEDLAL